MSQENVDLVRGGFDHFIATGDVPWEIFDDEVEVYDHDTPDQGIYRGHDGYGRWLGDWGAAWAEWSIEPNEFIDAGDRVVIFFRMQAKGRDSGAEVVRQDALVYQLHNGKIVRGDYYNNREQALKAAGLADYAASQDALRRHPCAHSRLGNGSTRRRYLVSRWRASDPRGPSPAGPQRASCGPFVAPRAGNRREQTRTTDQEFQCSRGFRQRPAARFKVLNL